MKNPPPLLGCPQWSSREREGEVKGPQEELGWAVGRLATAEVEGVGLY